MAGGEQYWTLELRRDELLDVVQRKGNQRYSTAREPIIITPSPGKISAIWRGEEIVDRPPLPQVIVGRPHDLDDLWAWALSYLRGLGPLSAQTRILTPEQYHSALQRKRNYRWWQTAGGFVGVVLGEAIVHTRQSLDSNEIGLVTCRSTLSFVLARASALGMTAGELNDLAVSWEKLRSSTGQPATAISADEVTRVAASLLAATDNRSVIESSGSRASAWFLQLMARGNANTVLSELNDVIVGPQEKNFTTLIQGTAEERVQFFDEFLPGFLDHSPFDRTERAFVIALVAFLSRPGLANQMSLLYPTMRMFPDAPLWLGAMQALYPAEETLAYGDGLGWRLSRDIFDSDDIFSTPRHDVSFAELQILLRSRSLTRTMRFLPRTRLDVELAPGVSTWIRSLSSERTDQTELPLDVRPSEREAAELRAKSVRDVERSLETALRVIRGIQLPNDSSSTSTRRKGRR